MATVDSHYARAILKCSIRRGFNVEQLMREAGLDKDCLDRQSARVEGEKITYMLNTLGPGSMMSLWVAPLTLAGQGYSH